MTMRRVLFVMLATGCSEHGSSVPDASVPDAKQFMDARLTTCVSPAGSASVTATPSLTFGRIYVGGIFGTGGVAPAAGTLVTLQLLITNAPEAAEEGLFGCEGQSGSCTTDGLSARGTAALDTASPLGSHPVSIIRTIGGGPEVSGNVTITEYEDPLTSFPGHITGTIATTTQTLTVNGSFSAVFCPLFMQFPI